MLTGQIARLLEFHHLATPPTGTEPISTARCSGNPPRWTLGYRLPPLQVGQEGGIAIRVLNTLHTVSRSALTMQRRRTRVSRSPESGVQRPGDRRRPAGCRRPCRTPPDRRCRRPRLAPAPRRRSWPAAGVAEQVADVSPHGSASESARSSAAVAVDHQQLGQPLPAVEEQRLLLATDAGSRGIGTPVSRQTE